MRKLLICFLLTFICSSIAQRIITCDVPIEVDTCKSPAPNSRCGRFHQKWCYYDISRPCCCPIAQRPRENCKSMPPCQVVCCPFPKVVCGYRCCDPTNIVNSKTDNFQLSTIPAMETTNTAQSFTTGKPKVEIRHTNNSALVVRSNIMLLTLICSLLNYLSVI